MEIESVTNAYAFLASDLLVPAPEKTVEKPEPAKVETPVATPTPAPVNAPITVADVKAVQPTLPAHDAPVPAPAPIPVPAKPVVNNPVITAPSPVLTPPPVAPRPSEIDEPAPRRIVRREGVVHMVGSIQAPTFFQLQSADNGELINYLHSSKTNISLDHFHGQKVIVTGEEYMDERWTNTPMIEIDFLQPAPNSRE
jgi:hypothetical protein